MADVHSKETRSYNMSRIRGKDTKPEWMVRRLIDPTWHEFENVEYTDEIPNTTLVLTDLIEVIQN